MKQKYQDIIQEVQKSINATVSMSRELGTGWSTEEKLYIKDEYGREFLVRVSPYSELDKWKYNFCLSQNFYKENICMAKPLIFTTVSDKYIITILTWIEGEELRDNFQLFTYSQHYNLGIEAGKNLKILHTDQKCRTNQRWFEMYSDKIDKKLYNYNKCNLKFKDDTLIIKFINSNIDLLKKRPVILQHGDYHDGNLIVDKNGGLGIIDYNRIDWGDPWQEFDKLIWTLLYSEVFPKGMIDGYFNCKVPIEFFQALALYSCVILISNLAWAVKYNKKDQVSKVMRQKDNILMWYRRFSDVIPEWYKSCSIY